MDRQSPASPGDVRIRVGRSPSKADRAVRRDRPRRYPGRGRYSLDAHRTNGIRLTMPSSSRTAQCGTAEARSRLRTASAYLEVAALVLDERDRDEYLNVS